MARPPRLAYAGGAYHVFARGNRRQPIHADDYDRLVFLHVLGEVVSVDHLRCLAFCLMTNHFHLVLESPRSGEDLSTGMQRLNGRYAQGFNQRHGHDGHVFQGRFGSKLVDREGALLSALRYVFLNPVKAGVCKTPEEWHWSSYAATVGRSPRPTFLSVVRVLELFAGDPRQAADLLAEFVAAGLPDMSFAATAGV